MATSRRSTSRRSRASTSSAADSPALPSAPQGSDAGSSTIDGSGLSSSEPFAIFDRATSSWRTCQGSLALETNTVPHSQARFSETWPRSGTMRNGKCYRPAKSERRRKGIASGSWPTPVVSRGDYALGARNPEGGTLKLSGAVKAWATPTASMANERESPATFLARQARNVNPAAPPLGIQIQAWATPAANDAKNASLPRSQGRRARPRLPGDVLNFLCGTEPLRSEAPTTRSDSCPPTSPNVGLNPRFGLWLQGFPVGWLESAPSATRSSRPSRSRSSAG